MRRTIQQKGGAMPLKQAGNLVIIGNVTFRPPGEVRRHPPTRQRMMQLVGKHPAPTRNHNRSIKLQLASLSAGLDLKDNTESAKRRGRQQLEALLLNRPLIND